MTVWHREEKSQSGFGPRSGSQACALGVDHIDSYQGIGPTQCAARRDRRGARCASWSPRARSAQSVCPTTNAEQEAWSAVTDDARLTTCSPAVPTVPSRDSEDGATAYCRHTHIGGAGCTGRWPTGGRNGNAENNRTAVVPTSEWSSTSGYSAWGFFELKHCDGARPGVVAPKLGFTSARWHRWKLANPAVHGRHGRARPSESCPRQSWRRGRVLD